MEIVGKKDGGSVKGPYTFRYLAFLGARKPAITGLAPVVLASQQDGKVLLFAEFTEPQSADTARVELSRDELAEIETGGADAIFNLCRREGLNVEGASSDSALLLLLAERQRGAAAAQGEAIDLLEAVRRVELAQSPTAAGDVDESSVRFDKAIRAERAAARKAGFDLGYAEAAERVFRSGGAGDW